MEFIKWVLFVLAWTLIGTVAAFAVAYSIWWVAADHAPQSSGALLVGLAGSPVGALAGFITGVILGARWNEKWR